MSLSNLLEQLSSTNAWDVQVSALHELRNIALTTHDANVLIGLKPYASYFISTITSPRSALLKAACELLQSLSYVYEHKLTQTFGQQLIPVLIRRVCVTKKVIRESVTEVLMAMMQHGNEGLKFSTVNDICEFVTSKQSAPSIRHIAAVCLGHILLPETLSSLVQLQSAISNAIVTGADDPDERVRRISRENWQKLAELHPPIAAQVLNDMSSSARRMLESESGELALKGKENFTPTPLPLVAKGPMRMPVQSIMEKADNKERRLAYNRPLPLPSRRVHLPPKPKPTTTRTSRVRNLRPPRRSIAPLAMLSSVQPRQRSHSRSPRTPSPPGSSLSRALSVRESFRQHLRSQSQSPTTPSPPSSSTSPAQSVQESVQPRQPSQSRSPATPSPRHSTTTRAPSAQESFRQYRRSQSRSSTTPSPPRVCSVPSTPVMAVTNPPTKSPNSTPGHHHALVSQLLTPDATRAVSPLLSGDAILEDDDLLVRLQTANKARLSFILGTDKTPRPVKNEHPFSAPSPLVLRSLRRSRCEPCEGEEQTHVPMDICTPARDARLNVLEKEHVVDEEEEEHVAQSDGARDCKEEEMGNSVAKCLGCVSETDDDSLLRDVASLTSASDVPLTHMHVDPQVDRNWDDLVNNLKATLAEASGADEVKVVSEAATVDAVIPQSPVREESVLEELNHQADEVCPELDTVCLSEEEVLYDDGSLDNASNVCEAPSSVRSVPRNDEHHEKSQPVAEIDLKPVEQSPDTSIFSTQGIEPDHDNTLDLLNIEFETEAEDIAFSAFVEESKTELQDPLDVPTISPDTLSESASSISADLKTREKVGLAVLLSSQGENVKVVTSPKRGPSLSPSRPVEQPVALTAVQPTGTIAEELVDKTGDVAMEKSVVVGLTESPDEKSPKEFVEENMSTPAANPATDSIDVDEAAILQTPDGIADIDKSMEKLIEKSAEMLQDSRSKSPQVEESIQPAKQMEQSSPVVIAVDSGGDGNENALPATREEKSADFGNGNTNGPVLPKLSVSETEKPKSAAKSPRLSNLTPDTRNPFQPRPTSYERRAFKPSLNKPLTKREEALVRRPPRRSIMPVATNSPARAPRGSLAVPRITARPTATTTRRSPLKSRLTSSRLPPPPGPRSKSTRLPPSKPTVSSSSVVEDSHQPKARPTAVQSPTALRKPRPTSAVPRVFTASTVANRGSRTNVARPRPSSMRSSVVQQVARSTAASSRQAFSSTSSRLGSASRFGSTNSSVARSATSSSTRSGVTTSSRLASTSAPKLQPVTAKKTFSPAQQAVIDGYLSCSKARRNGSWEDKTTALNNFSEALQKLGGARLPPKLIDDIISSISSFLEETRLRVLTSTLNALFYFLLSQEGEQQTKVLHRSLEKNPEIMRRVLLLLKDRKDDLRNASFRVLQSFDVQFGPEAQVALLIRGMCCEVRNGRGRVHDTKLAEMGCIQMASAFERANSSEGFVWKTSLLQTLIVEVGALAADRRVEVRREATKVLKLIKESLPEHAFEMACEKCEVKLSLEDN